MIAREKVAFPLGIHGFLYIYGFCLLYEIMACKLGQTRAPRTRRTRCPCRGWRRHSKSPSQEGSPSGRPSRARQHAHARAFTAPAQLDALAGGRGHLEVCVVSRRLRRRRLGPPHAEAGVSYCWCSFAVTSRRPAAPGESSHRLSPCRPPALPTRAQVRAVSRVQHGRRRHGRWVGEGGPAAHLTASGCRSERA